MNNAIISDVRFCKYCNTQLGRQKTYCSHSCQFNYMNDNKEKWHPIITDEWHQTMEGVIFSDGSLELQSSCNYPRFTFGQAENKREYVDFLANKLGLGQDRITPRKGYATETLKAFPSWVLASRTSPELTNYYERWYPNGKKVIPDDFKITPLSLMHVFLGDGCLTKEHSNYNRIFLYTNGFNVDNINNVFIKQLQDIGIDAQIKLVKCKGYDKLYPVTWFGKRQFVKRFFDFLPKNQVSCYNYKFISTI